VYFCILKVFYLSLNLSIKSNKALKALLIAAIICGNFLKTPKTLLPNEFIC